MKKIGGVSHFSDIFHVSRLLFTSVTHASPSLTASLAILVPKRSRPFPEVSKSQKSEHDTGRGLSRPHSPVPHRLRIEVKLRAASGRPIAYHPKQATPVIRGLCLKRGRSRPTGTLRGNGPSSSTGRGVAVAWSSKVQNQNHQVPCRRGCARTSLEKTSRRRQNRSLYGAHLTTS